MSFVVLWVFSFATSISFKLCPGLGSEDNITKMYSVQTVISLLMTTKANSIIQSYRVTILSTFKIIIPCL